MQTHSEEIISNQLNSNRIKVEKSPDSHSQAPKNKLKKEEDEEGMDLFQNDLINN